MLGLVALGPPAVLGGCGDSLLFSVGNLEVVPNPAVFGQAVTFAFDLTIVPEHEFTISAFIDDELHTSTARTGLVDGPFELDVGNATDLLARYGAGEHSARIVVVLTDVGREARTGPVTFELQGPSP
jgi:hypothetical protein